MPISSRQSIAYLFTYLLASFTYLFVQCPEYVAVSPVNGDIIVTDFERHTVVFFDKNGRYLTQYSGNDEDSSGSQQPTHSLGNQNGASQRKLKVH
jgi:DNA-binding beta-propeller fold protein YncE